MVSQINELDLRPADETNWHEDQEAADSTGRETPGKERGALNGQNSKRAWTATERG
jgi:hypothetical protein